MFVSDIMNLSPVICTEDVPLTQVYQLMLENNCDYIAVVDSYVHKIPIGIITEHEICLVTIAKGRNPRDLTASDVMNTNISKISKTLNLSDCSNLMQGSKTKKLFVIDDNGALCGTLSQFDVENSKNKQYFDDLVSRAMAKEYKPSGLNRIY
jgi:CBS domain-containing protein